MPDTFDLIAAERLRLADELERLGPEEWEAPSLCAGWTVHTVAAHLNAPWEVSLPTVAVAMARSFGNLGRAFDGIAHDLEHRLSPERCVAGLREHATSRFTPPMSPPEAPLTDVIVHGADMLHPLGRSVAVDPEAITRVLRWLTTANPKGFMPTSRRTGLVLVATDLDERFGEGPAEVRGPAVALAVGLLGRRPVLDQLDGEGVAILAARL